MNSTHQANLGQTSTNSGDARAISAEIEAWLASRKGPMDDHEALFDAIRRSLETICRMPSVRDDETARSILNEMVFYASEGLMEEFVTSLERLDRRLRSLRNRDGEQGQIPNRRRRAPRTLLRL